MFESNYVDLNPYMVLFFDLGNYIDSYLLSSTVRYISIINPTGRASTHPSVPSSSQSHSKKIRKFFCQVCIARILDYQPCAVRFSSLTYGVVHYYLKMYVFYACSHRCILSKTNQAKPIQSFWLPFRLPVMKILYHISNANKEKSLLMYLSLSFK